MGTRLLCMYGATYPAPATLDPRAEAALRRYAPQHGLEVEWIDTSSSLQVYADELDARWARGDDLILVEQDKEIHAGCLPELLACPELWCAYVFWQNPVPHTNLVLGGFGVTRFSAQIQEAVPVVAFRGPVQVGIDRRFYDHLLTLGVGCHLHGYVQHHHVYVPRPLALRRYVEELRAAGVIPPAMYPEPAGPHLLPGSYDLTG